MIFSSNSNKQTFDTMGGQVGLCSPGDPILGYLPPVSQQDNTSQSQQQAYTDTPPTYEVAVEETNGMSLYGRRVPACC